MKLLIRSVLAVLLYINIKDVHAHKCEDDMSRWFIANGQSVGDIVAQPANQLYVVDRPLKAFGADWTDGYNVVVRKGPATGEIRFFPKIGYRQPGAFVIRASRVNYEPSYLGNVKFRMTIKDRDINEIEKIVNQAYPCLSTGNFRPNHAFVATYTCMLHRGNIAKRDTFQVTVAGNHEKTFAIIQYHQLHRTDGLQFGFMERLGRRKFRFNDGKNREMAEILLTSTNGIRPGVWVFDITDSEPSTPELCAKDANMCTVTDYSMVHTFDGHTQVAPPEFMSVLASSNLDAADICNFEARIRTEVHGEIKFIEFFLGAITNANPQDRFNFVFDRQEDIVHFRGPKLGGAQTIVSFPHTYTEDENTIIIRKFGEGWVLISDHCDYTMRFRPDALEPVFRLSVGPKYAGLLEGYCENFDGDKRNDKDD